MFVDRFESIALDRLDGQFVAPARMQAELEVTVDDALATRLAVVSIDSATWLSNPVTGRFEPLPEGYGLDPTRLFDPAGQWRPLIEGLREITLVGIDQRGGARYVLEGIASAESVGGITMGLVGGADVPVTIWLHPQTLLITSLEFSTGSGDATTRWVVELSAFEESFTIEPPPGVAAAGPATTG